MATLQQSHLENPTDGGAWQAMVPGVKRLSTHTGRSMKFKTFPCVNFRKLQSVLSELLPCCQDPATWVSLLCTSPNIGNSWSVCVKTPGWINKSRGRYSNLLVKN